MIISHEVGTLYLQLIRHVLKGSSARPRGLATTELLNVHLLLADLRNNVLVSRVRNPNYRFMVAEWLWIMLGLDDVDSLAHHNAKMREYSDDGLTLAGAYGPRWQAQEAFLLKALRTDPLTRRAVITLWKPNPTLESRDIPCTVSLQFIRRPVERLNCIVTMRSSDAWLGIPYDVYSFSMLANYLAGALHLEPGWLAMNLGSAHLYGEHLQAARDLLNDATISHRRSPAILEPPPDWFRKALLGAAWITAGPPWEAYAQALNAPTLRAALDAMPHATA